MSSILSATTLLQPRQWPAGTFWAVLLTTLTAVFIKVFRRPAFPKNAPRWYKESDWPIVGSLAYYYGGRADFMRAGRQSSKTGNFSFYIGKKQIVGISGVETRRLFFESKELNFPQAYVFNLSCRFLASYSLSHADETMPILPPINTKSDNVLTNI